MKRNGGSQQWGRAGEAREGEGEAPRQGGLEAGMAGEGCRRTLSREGWGPRRVFGLSSECR